MKHNKVFNPFPNELTQKIGDTLFRLKKNGNVYAAFEADGSLWDTDLGENFFHYKIQNKLLENLPENPFEHYHTWKNQGDPRPAYLWLAQICKGHSIEKVRIWANEAVEAISPLPIFPAQRDLIRLLLDEKVKVFIVTASVKWAVEPAAKNFGLSYENVIGVETAIEKGVVTDVAAGHMTYREGKAAALLRATNGVNPFLCSGNTIGDSYLLDIATDFKIAVTGASSDNQEVLHSEIKFQDEVKKKQESGLPGWIRHQF